MSLAQPNIPRQWRWRVDLAPLKESPRGSILEFKDHEVLSRTIFHKEFKFELPNLSKRYDGTLNHFDHVTNYHVLCISKVTPMISSAKDEKLIGSPLGSSIPCTNCVTSSQQITASKSTKKSYFPAQGGTST